MIWCISIHAPLTGSDHPRCCIIRRRLYFNPRSPHRERHKRKYSRAPEYYFNPRSPHRERRFCKNAKLYYCGFQSTLPSLGATYTVWIFTGRRKNFNPRSPHWERHDLFDLVSRKIFISIHAPLTGSDWLRLSCLSLRYLFQSTLPSQGATINSFDRVDLSVISIHAPLTGSDGCTVMLNADGTPFQSTLPSQGATRGRL